jgi:hypothetical protein
MIKFIAAGLWLCAVTIGAVFYSFQSAAEKTAPEPPAPLLGGLDYVKTEVLSVPVLAKGGISGYFLTRLVYTVEPEKVKALSVPMDTLISDELYTYLYSNPMIDFTQISKLDLDTFRNGVRDSLNKRIGQDLVHDVMVEQIDFLTKQEIRDNAVRHRPAAAEDGAGSGKADAGEDGGH